jgi:hypothetical protein
MTQKMLFTSTSSTNITLSLSQQDVNYETTVKRYNLIAPSFRKEYTRTGRKATFFATNRPYRFDKVDTDHRSNLGDLMTSRPTNRVTRAISRLLKSRTTYWPDQIGPANVYSAQYPIRYLGSTSFNFSFKLVACCHAIFPVVLNCKLHSLHMYKRQVVLHRFFLGMDDLADKLPDLPAKLSIPTYNRYIT